MAAETTKEIEGVVTCTVVMVRPDALARDFDAWYRGEWPRLVATFTLVSGDRELARDIAAEALARALERWERVGRMASPGGWTYRVGTNLLRRHHRRRASERKALALVAEGSAESLSLAEGSELWIAVAALPRRERTVIALRYGAGMTEHEIAGALRVADGTVSATLSHARARLRGVLSESSEGVSHG